MLIEEKYCVGSLHNQRTENKSLGECGSFGEDVLEKYIGTLSLLFKSSLDNTLAYKPLLNTNCTYLHKDITFKFKRANKSSVSMF